MAVKNRKVAAQKGYPIRPVMQWTWLLVPVIAVGGLILPRLGLLLLPMMAALLILGFFQGKYWCGNICPHGSLFDVILQRYSRKRPVPKLFYHSGFRYGFFVLYMVLFALRVGSVIPAWGEYDFWDQFGFILALNYLIPSLVGSILAVAAAPRAWCRFCPMGTMQGLVYWLGQRVLRGMRWDSRLRMNAPETCKRCGLCERACPMGISPYQEVGGDDRMEHPDCIRCGACAASCPLHLLELGGHASGTRSSQASQTRTV